MRSSAAQLNDRQAESSAADQKSAIDELEKIWDAVIPFHPLLARDLADQSRIAQAIEPTPSTDTKADSKPGNGATTDDKKPDGDKSGPAPKSPAPAASAVTLGSEAEDLAPLTDIQERTLSRTQLLKLKAEAELARLEKTPPPDAAPAKDKSNPAANDPKNPARATPKPIDPKLIKAGYQKAIELAPRAVEQMGQVVKSLKQKNRQSAYPPAEQARKILEEIQKAQPKQDQEDQKKKDEDQQKQDQKDQQKNEQQKKDEKKDQKKDDPAKQDQQKKDQEQKKQEEPKKSDQQKQPQPQQVSRDRIEEALRKVRERQQEKRERDRTMKARLFGRVPVEKDW